MLLENERAFIDGRIQQLEHVLKNAQIIDTRNTDNIVDIGETVVIRTCDGELEQYTIVGVVETDPGHGLISNESPLGHALVGHHVGMKLLLRLLTGNCITVLSPSPDQ
ncbi:MAG: GreA/GreB family elongation factor [Ardenticatenaceae bacterium]|nr:GreA/GreB family elongation factor [Ardenticatenaceae bacterium]MCB9444161.1 GreA/GreB family elongation factor [Ardenticatenaceae bacterium]